MGRETVYVHDEGFYAEHDIELRLGRTAVGLDTSTRELALDDGERLRYERLLLTTDPAPRRLPIPGGELDGVLHLRSVQDSDALRAFADHGEVRDTISVVRAAADATLRRAREAGIDLDAITAQLEREGVRSFCDSYDQLLACIETKLGSTRPTSDRAGV